MALRFYVAGDHQIDQRLLLDSERSNYLCRVLRHRVGDVIEVFNGIGTVSSCKITSDDARKSELLVLSLTSSTKQHGLTLGIGISLLKGQPMDRAIAQATELGATDIYLMDTQRSNVRLNQQRISGKLEHWQKVIIASCEQCGQVHLPRLHPPKPMLQLLPELDQPDTHLVFFDPNAEAAPTQLPVQHRVVFVGPEGGYSPEELAAFARFKATGYRLGKLILRAETMPAAALTLIQQATGWRSASDP